MNNLQKFKEFELKKPELTLIKGGLWWVKEILKYGILNEGWRQAKDWAKNGHRYLGISDEDRNKMLF